MGPSTMTSRSGGSPLGGVSRPRRSTVRTRNIVAVGAVTSALLLAGCAGGATIKTTIGPGSPFCNDLATFAPEAATLSDAAAQSRATLLQALPPIQALLTKLGNEAPTGDTVNGKPVKADEIGRASCRERV